MADRKQQEAAEESESKLRTSEGTTPGRGRQQGEVYDRLLLEVSPMRSNVATTPAPAYSTGVSLPLPPGSPFSHESIQARVILERAVAEARVTYIDFKLEKTAHPDRHTIHNWPPLHIMRHLLGYDNPFHTSKGGTDNRRRRIIRRSSKKRIECGLNRQLRGAH